MLDISARTGFESIYERGDIPFGTFIFSTDPGITGAACSAGLDFVIVDREHGPNDTITTSNHIRAAQASDVIPFVRVLENSAGEIQASLDVGAHGIVVPKVGSADEARAALAATRYQPGGRGICPIVPAARWASVGEEMSAHVSRSNKEILLIPMIETRSGVENLAEIVAIPGVDYILFGAADLSIDLGLENMLDPESTRELSRIWAEILRVARAAGVRVMSVNDFARYGERADAMILSTDNMSMKIGLLSQKSAILNAQPGQTA